MNVVSWGSRVLRPFAFGLALVLPLATPAIEPVAAAVYCTAPDRIIDGVDQTALLLNGDSYSRRDYDLIYLGSTLATKIWKRYKRTCGWSDMNVRGVSASFYYRYNKPREQNTSLVQIAHFHEPFNRMQAVQELWRKKYPDQPSGMGPAFTGLSNTRPETLALSKPPVDLQALPFDPLEHIESLDRLPFDPKAEADLDSR